MTPFDGRGIFEIPMWHSLVMAIEMVEKRILDVSVEGLVVKGVRKVTSGVWKEKIAEGEVWNDQAEWM